jgi:glycosyltransferase involved in cell wall biosynthesis
MSQKIIYSVIIPHKNCPDLLQRCLDSIPRRGDIQIIVVDDNSDENKVNFSNFPGLEDEYVEIYLTKEGKGAGYARNIGLTYAKGKWLLFADADDFFHIDKFRILDKFQQNSSDIIYMGVDSVYSDTLKKAKRDKIFNELIFYYLKTKDDSRLRYGYLVPWGKMIKKSFVDKYNFRFDEVHVSNDVMFSIKTGFYANKVIVIDDIIYCVTVRNESLSNRPNYSKLLCRYKITLNANSFLKDKNKKQHQRPLVLPILKSFKYGIKSFIEFIKLTRAVNMNILSGFFLNRIILNKLFHLYFSLFFRGK